MKNVLICLESLGIGGVETFVITQIEDFTKRGIKCHVLAKDGILSKKIKDNKNVNIIHFDYELKNEIDFDKVKEVEKIIKTNKIDCIYIHQYPCILYVLVAAFKNNTPYVAYMHNIVPGTFDWFMNTYSIFKWLLPIYFENATKIIAIADKVKEEHKKIFNIKDSKYLVINNSLDFSKYPDKKDITIPKKYKKLLLIGRISELKISSIETAVDFYEWCKNNYNSEMILTVAGDGELFEEVKEKYKDKGIIFKGAVVDLSKEIENNDILLGVDRCALESVASKKPSIICGYNKNIALITPKNIKTCIKENFGGYSLNDNKEELFSLSEKDIKKIIEDNYTVVKKELSIDNSEVLNIDKDKCKYSTDNYFEIINSINLEYDKVNSRYREEISKNELLTKEINGIINSKRWKVINKVGSIKNKITHRR